MASAQTAWIALRRLYEGERAGIELLAECARREAATIERRVRKEGWRSPSDVHGQLNEALRRFGMRLLAEIDRLGSMKGEFGKAEYDAVNAMTRLLDKIADATRTAEGANEEREERPEDLAAILERIDRRIVELASELAARMGSVDARAT